VFVPDHPPVNVFVSLDAPAHSYHFNSDVMMREARHPLPAEAFDYEPPMVQAIAVHDDATAKEDTHPLARQEEGVKVVVPKTVVGNEGEHIRAQAEIDIHR
jgi:hypothetical protein